MSSQVLLTPQIITKEMLMILENNLVAANRVNRKFENQFMKIGSQLTIRKPNRFTIASGASLQVQDIAEPSVSITVDKQRHVDFQFTSQDLTLTVEEFSERYLKPAMAALANEVDLVVLQNVIDVSNHVGTVGVTPATFSSSVQLTGRRMDDNAAAQDNRTLVLNPAAYWAIANGLTPSFVMPTAKEALVKGYLATIGNYEVYMDQNIPNLTSGIHTTTNGIVTTAGQTGSSISTAGWAITNGTSDTFVVGDVVTFANVFNINPQSRQSTGVLKNFVITASTAVSGGGTTTATLQISPAIVTSGPYQNVTAGPANGAVVSILTRTGATASSATADPQNIAFTRDAFGLVMVPLEIPQGVDFAARETWRNISMRVIRAYDINNDVFPTRSDILFGDTVYYDELACRLSG
jgi:hypothetical protein